MKKALFFLAAWPVLLMGQSNMSLTNGKALNILKANYNPALYAPATSISGHHQILCELQNNVSTDTLQAYLEKLASFSTRNTWSDTSSGTRGIGAARRWVHQKFVQYGSRNENRLLPAYLVFDVTGNACGDLYGTKNVLGVLPGRDTTRHDILIIEGHMDSRCAGRCDTSCAAPGAEDNASGTALVMELARLMSRYHFDRTIVFMTTTGEEQGLLGAAAMAQFAIDENIAIHAVQNNDVVGGVICGNTSSPPGCAPPGSIDSTNLRIYTSPSSYLNPNQSFARSVAMFYEEKLKPQAQVPMSINVIDQEDRTGRGGDHIPFREQGFRNLRFTAAHEHGNAAATSPGYDDRQHTSNDILGIDTDSDGEIDSFFVDLNYLARNTVINGMSATLLAQGPDVPQFILHDEPAGLRVEVTSSSIMPEYRLGVRNGIQVDFDHVYSFTGNSMRVPNLNVNDLFYISIAAIDSNGIMSPFTTEELDVSQSATPPGTPANLKYGINCNRFDIHDLPGPDYSAEIQLLGNRPNPFSKLTEIGLLLREQPANAPISLVVTDQAGSQLAHKKLELQRGENWVPFHHRGEGGLLIYSVKVGQRVVASGKMLAQ